MRDDHDLESPVIERGHGEAHAIHGHRALGDEQGGEGGILPFEANARRLAVRLVDGDQSDAVHVTQHEVAAYESVEAHGPLEVDAIARVDIAERAPRQRLGAEVEGEM